MQKIVNKLITSSIKGVDVYRWKNATWLIFTDETRWVVELTDEGTLWYNYSFFNNVFKYVSMDLDQQTEKYIIGWANEHFFKVSALRSIANNPDKDRCETEKVLENGIKEVYDSSSTHRQMRAENLLGRIIRDVKPNIEYSEQTGVYDPDCNGNKTEIWRIVEEVKPNIVDVLFEEQIRCYYDPTCHANNIMITNIIEEGIKNTYPDMIPGDYNWQDEFDADKVIDGGTKL
jgi:hypothetical protein